METQIKGSVLTPVKSIAILPLTSTYLEQALTYFLLCNYLKSLHTIGSINVEFIYIVIIPENDVVLVEKQEGI